MGAPQQEIKPPRTQGRLTVAAGGRTRPDSLAPRCTVAGPVCCYYPCRGRARIHACSSHARICLRTRAVPTVLSTVRLVRTSIMCCAVWLCAQVVCLLCTVLRTVSVTSHVTRVYFR